MPRFALVTLLVLAGLPIAAQDAPKDVPGWRAARWGMSPEQVEAAFPGEAEWFAGLGIRNVTISLEITLPAIFGFSRDKLESVTLERTDYGSDSFAIQAFATLRAALAEKYGPPAINEEKETPQVRMTLGSLGKIPEAADRGGARTGRAVWSFPSTSITLTLDAIAEWRERLPPGSVGTPKTAPAQGTIKLLYQAKQKAAEDKL